MRELADATVIVRGGAVGMGLAVARALAAAGANLAIVGASKSKLMAARALADEHAVEVLPLFVSDEDEMSIRHAVADVAQEFGHIDAFVNCKLVARATLLEGLGPDELERTMRACTVTPFLWMRACHDHLARTRGTIIALSPESAREGMPATGALAAASHGLEALCQVAASEWADEGIGVHVLHARASTPQFEKWSREFPEDAREFDGVQLDTLESVAETCVSLICASA